MKSFMQDQTSRYPSFRTLIASLLIPNSIKCSRLRKFGSVGKNVRIGPGSVIKAKKITIEDNVSIGPGTVIQADELYIGAATTVGAMCYFDCPKIRIGQKSKIREQVIVGGVKTPRSSLSIGNQVTIYQFTFLNPTETITVGNRVGIGGRCSFFTHGSWQSMFKGYPVDFGPISIEDDVWFGWEVFVLPNIKIGKGSTIGARALVTKNVSPLTLVAGTPAKILKAPPDYPAKIDMTVKRKMLKDVIDQLIDLSTFRNLNVKQEKINSGYSLLFEPENGVRLTLLVIDSLMDDNSSKRLLNLTERDVAILLDESMVNAELIRNLRCSWMMIDQEKCSIKNNFGKELMEFLERYGVRFPIS